MYKHLVFNPCMGTLQQNIDRLQPKDSQLIQIVPYSPYEAVMVLQVNETYQHEVEVESLGKETK